jgi:hypothetical protein
MSTSVSGFSTPAGTSATEGHYRSQAWWVSARKSRCYGRDGGACRGFIENSTLPYTSPRAHAGSFASARTQLKVGILPRSHVKILKKHATQGWRLLGRHQK